LTFQPLEAVGSVVEGTMHTIGEFARLTQVPEKTLRYYDALGLLCPRRAPGTAGYRSYGAGDLERLNRILALKDAGFSLAELRTALGDAMTTADLAELAERSVRRSRTSPRVPQLRARRAAARLELLARLDEPLSFSMTIARPGPAGSVSVRDTLATHGECERLFEEIAHAAPGVRHSGDLCGAIWHACAPGRIDCEAFAIATAEVSRNSRVRAASCARRARRCSPTAARRLPRRVRGAARLDRGLGLPGGGRQERGLRDAAAMRRRIPDRDPHPGGRMTERVLGPLRSRPLFRLEIELHPIQVVGPTPLGERRWCRSRAADSKASACAASSRRTPAATGCWREPTERFSRTCA
jgi:DNA-binding transcriptional MerR regulator